MAISLLPEFNDAGYDTVSISFLQAGWFSSVQHIKLDPPPL
jgi:hypothetical protein